MQNAHAFDRQIETGEEAMSAVHTNGGTVLREIPKPDTELNGKVLDAHGHTVRPATPTLMARLDLKGSEKIEVSRSTLWFVGTALVLLGVVFSYGSSMLAWVRDDETQRVKMSNVERQVEEMRNEVKELKTMMQEQRVKDAETKGKELGYSVGRADKNSGH